MARMARQLAGTGFYHVVSKGDGGRLIFESDKSRLKYLTLLDETLGEHRVLLHAYCLMGNHVHLLLQDPEDELSAFMKRLNESYARYFAWTTGHVGHVFQGRFWSGPIDTDERFLTTMRYIHANPEPARICRAQDYPWSSYRAYTRAPSITSAKGHPSVEVQFALSLLGGVESFAQFSRSGGNYPRPFPECAMKGHLSDDEMATIAVNLLGRDVLTEIRSMEPKKREAHLARLSRAGFSKSEIARLTGLGKTSISRALRC
ncbi:MAG: hypothetical protein E7000_00185 [Coriobacteriaceae bacterium]|nr:hypothetical protein [Coriobacteriaceae bacterium]